MRTYDNYSVELFYNSYLPNEKIKWKYAPVDKTKYKYNRMNRILRKDHNLSLYKTNLFNSTKINGTYYIRLYMLFSEKKQCCSLYLEGNLSDWYYQERLDRNLSSIEYADCLKFLLSEIGVVDIPQPLDSIEADLIYNQIHGHKEYKYLKKPPKSPFNSKEIK